MDIKKECFELYCKAFGKDEFAYELFSKCFNCCKWYEIDGKPVSILFLLPCKISVENITYDAKYIFAVTTDENYRNKGIMFKLLSSLNCNDVLFLKPANDKLISYYKKLGYKIFDAIKSRAGDKKVILCDEFANLAEKYSIENNEDYKAMYRYKHNIDLNGLNFSYTME